MDPKLIVYASVIGPAAYNLFNTGFNMMTVIVLGLAAWGLITFNSNFVNIEELKKRRRVPILGPEQPFVPDKGEWVMGAEGPELKRFPPGGKL